MNTNPYRNAKVPQKIKLPRLKARIRGLFRRIFIPTIIVAILGGTIGIINYNFVLNYKRVQIKIEEDKKYLALLNNQQAALNAKEKELTNKSIELNEKLKNNQNIPNNLKQSLAQSLPQQGMYFEDAIKGYETTIVRFHDKQNNKICYVAMSNILTNSRYNNNDFFHSSNISCLNE